MAQLKGLLHIKSMATKIYKISVEMLYEDVLFPVFLQMLLYFEREVLLLPLASLAVYRLPPIFQGCQPYQYLDILNAPRRYREILEEKPPLQQIYIVQDRSFRDYSVHLPWLDS